MRALQVCRKSSLVPLSIADRRVLLLPPPSVLPSPLSPSPPSFAPLFISTSKRLPRERAYLPRMEQANDNTGNHLGVVVDSISLRRETRQA